MKFRFLPDLSRAIAPLLAITAGALLSSCAMDADGNLTFDLDESSRTGFTSKTGVDAKSKYYSKGHYIYVNELALASLKSSEAKVVIDLGEQRAKVYKSNGSKGDKLVIETQISTGKSEYPTPTGKYRVLEKTPKKESNLYGKWLSPSGKVLVSDGDIREPPSGEAIFKGADMPYWMRVTSGGVGMHIGYVPGYRASHGCIRVPSKVQPLIYRHVRVGTPVEIRG